MKKLGLKGWLRGYIADDGTQELLYSEFSMKHEVGSQRLSFRRGCRKTFI